MQLIMFKHFTDLEFIQRPENIFKFLFCLFLQTFKHYYFHFSKRKSTNYDTIKLILQIWWKVKFTFQYLHLHVNKYIIQEIDTELCKYEMQAGVLKYIPS